MTDGPSARGRALIVCTGLLALLVAPAAVAQQADGPAANAAAISKGDPLRAAVRNGTTRGETEIIGKLNATGGAKGGYVTRQSNTATGAKAGGGAIYGCRGAAGGTASGSAPCLRASNLTTGYAFELSTGGLVAGLITVGNPAVPNPGAKPFTTNATGVATGLNADKVDGQDASEIAATPGPPNGAAGGSLAGSYPNPTIAAGAVGSSQIADGSVGTADIASDARGVAVGGVRSDAAGTVLTWFNRRGGKPTITHVAASGRYDVAFPGSSFNININAIPTATQIGSAPGFATVSTVNGGVIVRTTNAAAAPVATDRAFTMTVFGSSSTG